MKFQKPNHQHIKLIDINGEIIEVKRYEQGLVKSDLTLNLIIKF